MVDVGFTQAWFKDEGRFVKKSLRVAQQLRYKYLIALEGNDIASGLKWMLFSDSVVLMPAVKVATWALEGTLQPFVHYIPLKPDGSDLLQMVRWARSNDGKVREISRRATLFMYDFLFHPDAASDNAEVRSILVKRYEAGVRLKGAPRAC
uniref:Glycosyl transferase CAP10 domain-containing protein n=1 Tax=Haptolina brevifila TaxID=156173 RepID=A0A7S2HQ87_9EUKA